MNLSIDNPIYDGKICRAKDPAQCPYHSQIAAYEKRMAECEAASDFSGYYEARHQKDLFTGQAMMQAGDFESYAQAFPESWQQEQDNRKMIASHLRQMNTRGNYRGMSWSLFAQLAVNYLSPQSYGSVLQNRWMRELEYNKVNASAEQGDFWLPSGNNKKYVEFKVTAADGDKRNGVNFVQIRPHHNLHRYHMVIVNKENGESQFFSLSKNQMEYELKATKAALAHGTRTNPTTGHKEYAIRFDATSGNEVYERWLRRYHKKEFPIK